MNCRSQKLALSHNHNEIYEETTSFLKEIIFITENMFVSNRNEHWKPFQTGIILATQTALDIQEEYLNNKNFRYLMLGRLTQDALENLFSNVRSRNPVPNPKEFKCALRLIAISQFFTPPKHGNYGVSDCEEIADFLQNNKITDIDIDMLSYEDDIELTISSALNVSEQQSLYCLLGSVLYKVKKNFGTCNTCYAPTITDCNDENVKDINKLVTLRCYKENSLVFPSKSMYQLIFQAECFSGPKLKCSLKIS